jgi:hypothetical protein
MSAVIYLRQLTAETRLKTGLFPVKSIIHVVRLELIILRVILFSPTDYHAIAFPYSCTTAPSALTKQHNQILMLGT